MAIDTFTDEPKRASVVLWVLAGLFRVITKLMLVVAFIAFGLFAGGFLKFSSTIAGYDIPADIEKAEAVVVLTGGASRIVHALDLLEARKGDRLLISGANPNTKPGDIRKANDSRQTLFDCCVDLESEALNTAGNATETGKWAKLRGYKSLIVVTSAYHMPRSMLEFRRAMPDLVLRPYPIPLKSLKEDGWWKNAKTLRFVLSEYTKYLGAGLRDYVRPEFYTALRATVRNG